MVSSKSNAVDDYAGELRLLLEKKAKAANKKFMEATDPKEIKKHADIIKVIKNQRLALDGRMNEIVGNSEGALKPGKRKRKRVPVTEPTITELVWKSISERPTAISQIVNKLKVSEKQIIAVCERNSLRIDRKKTSDGYKIMRKEFDHAPRTGMIEAAEKLVRDSKHGMRGPEIVDKIAPEWSNAADGGESSVRSTIDRLKRENILLRDPSTRIYVYPHS